MWLIGVSDIIPNGSGLIIAEQRKYVKIKSVQIKAAYNKSKF